MSPDRPSEHDEPGEEPERREDWRAFICRYTSRRALKSSMPTTTTMATTTNSRPKMKRSWNRSKKNLEPFSSRVPAATSAASFAGPGPTSTTWF